jgi:hypothetical protein
MLPDSEEERSPTCSSTSTTLKVFEGPLVFQTLDPFPGVFVFVGMDENVSGAFNDYQQSGWDPVLMASQELVLPTASHCRVPGVADQQDIHLFVASSKLIPIDLVQLLILPWSAGTSAGCTGYLEASVDGKNPFPG